MAKKVRNIEFDQSIEEKEKSFSLRDLLDGNVLTRKAVVKQSRFILLLVLIAFASIANRNHAEKTVIRLVSGEKKDSRRFPLSKTMIFSSGVSIMSLVI